MKRTTILIISAFVLFTLLSAVVLVATSRTQPQNLGGPGVIFLGTPAKHGFLGILFFEPEPSSPLKVKHVFSGTGADDAGILPGDDIVNVDAHAVPNNEQLHLILQDTTPDSLLPITIKRDGQDQELNVRLISIHDFVRAQQNDTTSMEPSR